MTFLHLNNDHGTMVHTPDGFTIRKSRNLRGMRDYARVSPVTKIETRKDGARGILRVEYANGNYSIASFCSYHIMIDWVRNRRSWRHAIHTMHDEDVGYLTKP